MFDPAKAAPGGRTETDGTGTGTGTGTGMSRHGHALSSAACNDRLYAVLV